MAPSVQTATMLSGPFLRLRPNPTTIGMHLRNQGINATLIVDNEAGIFQGTTKLFTQNGRDVPKVLKYLRDNFEKLDGVWEPKQPKDDFRIVAPFVNSFPPNPFMQEV